MTSFRDRRDYLRQTFAPETAELKAIRESLTDNISIHAEDGRLLQFLIGLANVKSIVEIGTFGGYSAIWMANALPEDGKLITIEKDEARAAAVRDTLAPHKKIALMVGDALDVMKTLQGPFDMVFIDADKLSYLEYLDWAEKNVRTGGLIIGDNTFLFDAVWNDGPVDRVRETARRVMREFNLRLADPARYDSILLPTIEGMTIARKKF